MAQEIVDEWKNEIDEAFFSNDMEISFQHPAIFDDLDQDQLSYLYDKWKKEIADRDLKGITLRFNCEGIEREHWKGIVSFCETIRPLIRTGTIVKLGLKNLQEIETSRASALASILDGITHLTLHKVYKTNHLFKAFTRHRKTITHVILIDARDTTSDTFDFLCSCQGLLSLQVIGGEFFVGEASSLPLTLVFIVLKKTSMPGNLLSRAPVDSIRQVHLEDVKDSTIQTWNFLSSCRVLERLTIEDGDIKLVPGGARPLITKSLALLTLIKVKNAHWMLAGSPANALTVLVLEGIREDNTSPVTWDFLVSCGRLQMLEMTDCSFVVGEKKLVGTITDVKLFHVARTEEVLSRLIPRKIGSLHLKGVQDMVSLKTWTFLRSCQGLVELRIFDSDFLIGTTVLSSSIEQVTIHRFGRPVDLIGKIPPGAINHLELKGLNCGNVGGRVCVFINQCSRLHRLIIKDCVLRLDGINLTNKMNLDYVEISGHDTVIGGDIISPSFRVFKLDEVTFSPRARIGTILSKIGVSCPCIRELCVVPAPGYETNQADMNGTYDGIKRMGGDLREVRLGFPSVGDDLTWSDDAALNRAFILCPSKKIKKVEIVDQPALTAKIRVTLLNRYRVDYTNLLMTVKRARLTTDLLPRMFAMVAEKE